MNIAFKNHNEPLKIQDGWHLLTVAESGFSMLSGYASEYGIDDIDIREFEERVNSSNESGTLHPKAPISTIPCKYFRELSNSSDPALLEEFKGYIKDFIKVNNNSIKAKNLLIEFRVSPSPVPRQYIDATNNILKSYRGDLLENVIIQKS